MLTQLTPVFANLPAAGRLDPRDTNVTDRSRDVFKCALIEFRRKVRRDCAAMAQKSECLLHTETYEPTAAKFS